MINHPLGDPMLNLLSKEVWPFVEKPARYAGGEKNSVRKSPEGKTGVCLIYPDIYEVGISNLGLKILYHLLNCEPDFYAERAYAPWGDMEAKLREKGLPLYSLESFRPLGEFDILGISFQYELLYTNFLNILDLSGIALRSKDRPENAPFIFGGGPASLNLEPVAPFLDAVCVGDGESRIVEMSKTVREGRQKGLKRAEILRNLSGLAGVYVPSIYNETIVDGFVVPEGPEVCRYSEPDLDRIDFVTEQILPSMQAVQDRAVVEVARGCTRGCRFCQAGIGYRPVRERSVGNLLHLAAESVRKTGCREVSLISLSISDYSRLGELIEGLDRQFKSHGVSFSLPSLRLDSFTLDLAQKVREIRKSGLTFAVEGGTQMIRDRINKGVKEEELFGVVDIASKLGWRSVKLYFMLGLPGASVEEEVNGIVDLAGRLALKYSGINITVSAAVFIPKPQTPFQWEKQLSAEEGEAALRLLSERMRRYRRVNVRWNSPKISFLEGVFARGDRKLSDAVELAFKKGARFDGWNDRVDVELWKNCFVESGIDSGRYLDRRDNTQPLSWGHISSGAGHEFLENELKRAGNGELTADCREACVNGCGACDFKTLEPKLAKPEVPVVEPDFLSRVKLDAPATHLVRFAYSRRESARFITPADLEEVFVRSFFRANLPVVFTKGFNPRIRVDMGWALPTGFESDYEVAETTASEVLTPAEWLSALNAALPYGIAVTEVRIEKLPFPGFSRTGKSQWIDFEVNTSIASEELARRLELAANFEKVTSKVTKTMDLRPYIRKAESVSGKLLAVYSQEEGGARIQDVILALTGLDVREAAAAGVLVKRRTVEREGAEVPLVRV